MATVQVFGIGLCLVTLEDHDAASTKERCRQQYTNAGYTITENIGNRLTDLDGGDYEKGFKLPDYNGQLL